MNAHEELAGLTNVQGNAGGGPQRYYRRDKSGNLIAADVDRTEHVLVSNGYYKLRVTGMTPIFPMDGQYGKSKNVRFEFTVNDPKSPEHKKRFSQLFPIQRHDSDSDAWYSALTPRTQTGKLFKAIYGRDIERGETVDVTAFVGREFMGVVTINESEKNGTTYRDSRVAKDSFRQVGSTDVPETPDAVEDELSAPEPVTATAKAASGPSAFSDDLDDL